MAWRGEIDVSAINSMWLKVYHVLRITQYRNANFRYARRKSRIEPRCMVLMQWKQSCVWIGLYQLSGTQTHRY